MHTLRLSTIDVDDRGVSAREMTNNYTISSNISDFPDVAKCRRMDEDAGIVFGTIAVSLRMVAMMVAAFVLALGGAVVRTTAQNPSIDECTLVRTCSGRRRDGCRERAPLPSSPPFPSLG